MTTRILLVDDHEIVRRGIRSLLESEPEFEVCAEAADGRLAVELAERLKPDVVVMDLALPGLNGIEATRQIHRSVRSVRVLVLSLHESEHFAAEALAAGAQGYVFKSDAAQEVVVAVKALHDGKQYLTRRLAPFAERLLAKRRGRRKVERTGGMTRREIEVLQLLAEGHTNKTTGERLGISIKTVETHRARLMKKLAIRSLAELVRYAVREHIVAAS
ncbi:MAG: response regulator transcription factor [Chthoniobacteraceae bacterium]